MNLRRSPGFFALAVALLACGLAAVTIFFTVADALLLKPLAAERPAELVRFVSVRPQLGPRSSFRAQIHEAWRRGLQTMSQMGVAHEMTAAYRDGDRTERVLMAFTSNEWLETFGVAERFRADDGVLLSHRFWQSRYAGDSGVVGRQVRIHGEAFTIAGVLPEGFNGATVETGPDVRVPRAALRRFGPEDDRDFEVVGRLKPGVSRESARDEAYALYKAAANEQNDVDLAPKEFDLEPLEFGASRLRTQARAAVWFATGTAALLALMVCFSLSGLMLARVMARQGEFAVRQALGASRAQLAGLILRELAVAALAATALAAVLTTAGLRLVAAALPPVRLLGRTTAPMALRLEPDWRVLAFGLAAAIAAMALIALAPAWKASRADLTLSLRSARVTGTGSRRLLLAAQAGLCTVLLLAAAQVRSSLENLRRNAPSAPVVTADVDRLMAPGLQEERFARVLEQWSAKVRALPGVQGVSYSGVRRLRGSGLKMTVVPEGERVGRDRFLNTSTMAVGAGFFTVNRIPLLAGRELTDTERYTKMTPQPTIASEAFARQYGGAQAILGRRFGSAPVGKAAGGDMVIVGVAGNTVYRDMRENAAPVLYAALGGVWDRMTLTVRTELPAAALAPALRQTLREIEPALTVEEIATMAEDVESSLWNERAVALVATLFAALAMGIVAAGLFAFVAYLASARRREMGIRAAIGARPGNILRLMLGEGLLPVLMGAGLGLAVGAALTRWAQAFLYGVTGSQPLTQAAVAAAMIAVGAAACLAPAWRASRVAPAAALRAE